MVDVVTKRVKRYKYDLGKCPSKVEAKAEAVTSIYVHILPYLIYKLDLQV